MPSDPLKVTCVALVADTVKVLELPAVIDAGLAEILTVGLSCTGALLDAAPPQPAKTARRGRIKTMGNLQILQREDRKLVFIGNLFNCRLAIFYLFDSGENLNLCVAGPVCRKTLGVDSSSIPGAVPFLSPEETPAFRVCGAKRPTTASTLEVLYELTIA